MQDESYMELDLPKLEKEHYWYYLKIDYNQQSHTPMKLEFAYHKVKHVFMLIIYKKFWLLSESFFKFFKYLS